MYLSTPCSTSNLLGMLSKNWDLPTYRERMIRNSCTVPDPVLTVSRPSKNPAQVDVLYDLVSWDWFKVNVWLDFTARSQG